MDASIFIGWAKYSFNSRRGGNLKSRGCVLCYRIQYANRWGQDPTLVSRSSDDVWKYSYRWNRQMLGNEPMKERIVFVNSMSEFFIILSDACCEEVYPLLKQTANFLYLILTNYPERGMSLLPNNWSKEDHPKAYSRVIIGTSVEDQKTTDLGIPDLMKIRANYKVFSFEPDQEAAAGIRVFVDKLGSQLAHEFKLSAKAGQRVEEWEQLSWRFPQDYLTVTH